MFKIIKVESCVGCDYSNHGHSNHCHHPDIKWGTLDVNKFVYNKTIHPDCTLDDEVDIVKELKNTYKKLCKFNDEEIAIIKRDATKHIRAVLKKVGFKRTTNTLELITAIRADLKEKETNNA